mmetsp:Transcript_10069/g.29517  ORF Transcript_10069/g.29517 Transcript_10069/m.29517 type:complete len:357 (+) Transcript_10069:218-1288(+)
MGPARDVVVAGSCFPSFARHAAALVALVADQVDCPIRAGALSSPGAHTGRVVDDLIAAPRLVGLAWPHLVGVGLADHLAERPLILAAGALARDAALARGAPARVPPVANHVDPSIWTRALAAPHPDPEPVVEVDHVPRLRTFVLRPLLRVQHLVFARPARDRFGALEDLAQHVVAHAQPVVRPDLALAWLLAYAVVAIVRPAGLEDLRAKPLTGADPVVPVADNRPAWKVHAESLRAGAHSGGEAGGLARGVAGQLQRLSVLVELVLLPRSRLRAVRDDALACLDLVQPVLGVSDAEPGGAAVEPALVVAPHVLALAEELDHRVLRYVIDPVENRERERIGRRVVHSRGAKPAPHQ